MIKQPFWVRQTKNDPVASTHYSNFFITSCFNLYGVFKMKNSWDFMILHTEASEFVGNIFITSAAEHLTCEKCY